MKKLLFTLTSLFLFSISISAQSDSLTMYGFQTEFTIEPFISLSSSGFVLEDDFFPEERVNNFAAGVLVEYHFNPRWSIRSGMIYDKMGDVGVGLDDRTYISIPLMANWHFGKRKRWNLGFGVTQSFGSEDDFFADELKNFLSSSVDIGYSFPVGPGFMRISSNGITSFTKTFNLFTQSRNLTSVGYIFRL